MAITLVPRACNPASPIVAAPVICGAGVGTAIPTVCVVAAPTVDLFVTKVYVGPTPLIVGDNGNFRVVVGNNGPATAVNVVVTDTVPFANASTVNDPVSITYAGGATGPGSISWADLAAGLLVLPSVPVGGTATLDGSMNFYGPDQQDNNVSVAADPSQTDTNLTNNIASASVSALNPRAEISVVKTISGNAFAIGDTGTMTIVTSNAGPQTDPNVSIFDNTSIGLGPNLTFALPFNVTYTGGATGPATVTSLPVLIGADMPPGSTATIVMPFTATTATGAEPNTAQVTPSLSGELNTADNTSTITASVSAVAVPQADLQVVKTASAASYQIGASGSYTVFATNNGPAIADGGTVSDTLPAAGVLTVGAGPYPVVYGGGASGPATTSFPLTITTWPVGGTASIVVPFTATAAGSVGNTATVAPPAGTNDPTPGNNSSTVSVTVAANRQVEISSSKSGADPTVGAATTWTNTHTNVGLDVADGLTVIDAPGAGYDSRWGISDVLAISVTYTGGATGPGSVTRAQLLAGFTVTTWPVGAQVIVSYSMLGINNVAGTNENCAGVRAVPGITLVNSPDFCTQFSVNGTSNCACAADLSVTPTDIFLGQSHTMSYVLPTSASCCQTTEFRRITYPTFEDARAGTNGVETALGFGPCSTFGASGSFLFTPPTAGFYRYFITVINNGSPTLQECSITDTDQLFGSAPLPSRASVIASGNWAVHNVV